MQKIIYTNKQKLSKVLIKTQKDGLKNLHFLVDFDNTLTKAFVDGKKIPSLVSAVRGEKGLLGKKCAIEDEKLFNKYYPIEIDPNFFWKKKVNIGLNGGKRVWIYL